MSQSGKVRNSVNLGPGETERQTATDRAGRVDTEQTVHRRYLPFLTQVNQSHSDWGRNSMNEEFADRMPLRVILVGHAHLERRSFDVRQSRSSLCA